MSGLTSERSDQAAVGDRPQLTKTTPGGVSMLALAPCHTNNSS